MDLTRRRFGGAVLGAAAAGCVAGERLAGAPSSVAGPAILLEIAEHRRHGVTSAGLTIYDDGLVLRDRYRAIDAHGPQPRSFLTMTLAAPVLERVRALLASPEYAAADPSYRQLAANASTEYVGGGRRVTLIGRPEGIPGALRGLRGELERIAAAFEQEGPEVRAERVLVCDERGCEAFSDRLYVYADGLLDLRLGDGAREAVDEDGEEAPRRDEDERAAEVRARTRRVEPLALTELIAALDAPEFTAVPERLAPSGAPGGPPIEHLLRCATRRAFVRVEAGAARPPALERALRELAWLRRCLDVPPDPAA